MKHQELINKFREDLSSVVREVEISAAMSHFDINLVCENLVCGLFRELFDLRQLRNLNGTEQKNFPGIDLADDEARVAIQVTSDKSLVKVKETLDTFMKNGLADKYDRVLIYCLKEKQSSYSQESIDKVHKSKFQFDVKRDILDFRDIASRAASAEPKTLKACVEILGSYLRGCDVGLAAEDFDPPKVPPETISTNLVELYLPVRLYIAEVKSEIISTRSGSRVQNQRTSVAAYSRKMEKPLPSGFEVSSTRLITFHNLIETNNPYSHLLEDGTAEELNPVDYYEVDVGHERVFKSLLRLSLQEKIFHHRVIWQYKENVFIFLPMSKDLDTRKVSWMGLKKSNRTVFERKYYRNDAEKIFQVKHFSFSVEFLLLDTGWYVSITPDWFFSWGDNYERSVYGDKPLSGLKKMEKNRSLYDQFRFLASWLKDIDQDDLFKLDSDNSSSISFGEILELEGGRHLNEELWAPLVSLENDDSKQSTLIPHDNH